MGQLKEKLLGALGGFGVVLWFVVGFSLLFAPFIIIHFNTIVLLILLGLMIRTQVIGGILRFGLYVWATVVALSMPIDTRSTVFLVMAAIYYTYTLFNVISSIVSSFSTNAEE